jgi:Holliday junction resolvasome RuvABC endonuclease subunit
MTNTIIKILSIDPGFTCLGWSLLEYNIELGTINIVKYGDLKILKQIKKQKELAKIYDRQVLSSMYLETEMLKLINSLKPHFTVIEDVFINISRPQAYSSLLLCVHVISRILYQYFQQPLYKISPRSVKMIVTGTGNSDKELIHDTILNNEKIKIKENKQITLDKLLSHHTDAMAVGFSFINTILPTLTEEQFNQGINQYNK